MKLSTLTYKGYTGRVVNVSQSKDITDYVEECYITLPNSSYISSMEAKFTLYEKLIEAGNEVRIEVLDEVENVIYLLHGKATIPKRSKQYTGVETFEYSIKDSYDKLFDKVVAEDMTFYDLYFCNTGDKGNSLLHKIAISLGFREDQCDFQDAIFPDGKYMRIPFIYLEENTRWVDKLQAFLEATNGILYAQNGMLHFRMRDSNVDMGLRFDRSNLLNHIEESQKELLQNGVKIVYDRYEKLENQVVFNLQKKIITEANTNQDTEVPTMRIGYITSSVSNPVLTKATGYFFTSDDPASKTDITLKEKEHYVIESWSATGAEVRFYNPLPHKLYIDNFEIKGIPLAMYESNEANVMFSNVLEKSQENLMTSTKSSMVQTREQADYLARKTMQKAIVNGKEYSFTTEFLHSIQIGKRYYLTLEDIQEEVEVRSIRISLRPNQFYMDIVADSMTKPLGEVKISNKYSATLKESYIDLRPVEEELKKQGGELKKLDRDVRSKFHKMNKVPTENVEENDIWLNPDANEWKKFYNGVWNPISEKEILPSMKIYNSLDGNVIKLQGTADKVGAYLLNDGEKFGSLNGELAHVTFDKLGQFEAENPNNRVALNIKDPANPYRVTSQILLGVTDTTDEKWKDVIFAIGDEATKNRLIFKNGKLQQTVNGQELSDKLSDVDRNINNLAEANAENKRTLEAKIEQAKEEASRTAQASKEAAQRYADALTEAEQIRADKNATEEAKKQAEEKLQLAKTYAEQQAEKSKIAAQKYADGKLQQFTQSIQTDIESIKSQLDGVIETWFYDDEPTLYNKPASDWTTTSEKEKHVGDLYYSKNGKSYRFMKDSNGYYSTYKWTEIADTDVAKALEEARKAKDTADKKRRVFVETPRPPYDEGDLWVKNDKVQVCQQTKEKGQFSVYDWRALSYTDDTKANEVEGKVNQNKEELDRNINNLAQADSENKRDLEQKITQSKQESDKKLEDYKKEINPQLVNANGQLTRLQEEYQKMDKNISNFETQVTGNFDSYESRLQQGNFVVTGNTVFDGNVNIVSKGTNERLQINQGSIETFRTFQNIEYKVSRMGNSRSGLVETDSKGKGTIELVGFKQPIQIICALSTVSFGKNLSDIICKAENTTNTPWPTYKFYLGATNEHYIEPKPIKVVGQEWSTENAVESTLLGIEGRLKGHSEKIELQNVSNSSSQYYEFRKKESKVLKTPKFKLEILRVEEDTEEVLIAKEYEVPCSFEENYWAYRANFNMNEIDFSQVMNLLKRYEKRTNLKYKMRITILEKDYEIEKYYASAREKGSHGDRWTEYHSSKYIGILKTITLADFTGFSITASAATSTLGDIQGEGTVQYLAFETE